MGTGQKKIKAYALKAWDLLLAHVDSHWQCSLVLGSLMSIQIANRDFNLGWDTFVLLAMPTYVAIMGVAVVGLIRRNKQNGPSHDRIF